MAKLKKPAMRKDLRINTDQPPKITMRMTTKIPKKIPRKDPKKKKRMRSLNINELSILSLRMKSISEDLLNVLRIKSQKKKSLSIDLTINILSLKMKSVSADLQNALNDQSKRMKTLREIMISVLKMMVKSHLRRTRDPLLKRLLRKKTLSTSKSIGTTTSPRVKMRDPKATIVTMKRLTNNLSVTMELLARTRNSFELGSNEPII